MPPLVSALLSSLNIVSIPFCLAISFAARRLLSQRERDEWNRNALVLFLLQALFLLLHSPRAAGLVVVLIALWGGYILYAGNRRRQAQQQEWEQRFRGESPKESSMPAPAPLRLELPFEGFWQAISGESDPAHNQHFTSRAQWFAYDFVRLDAATSGSLILSPVTGTVVGFENTREDLPYSRFRYRRDYRHPFGNFVAIAVDGRPGVYVFLCHLQQGSMDLAVGRRLATGQPVGRCGNSGNTTRPHLHVHGHQEAPHRLGTRAAGNPGQPGATGVPILWVQEGKSGRIGLGTSLAGRDSHSVDVREPVE